VFDGLQAWFSRQFVSEDAEQTAQQVADAQQAILDRQFVEGKRDLVDYQELSGEVQSADGRIYNQQLGQKGLTGFVLATKWVWILGLGGLALWFFWPRIVAMFRKSRG